MCKGENRLLDFKHSIFSSTAAPRTKGKRRNNKLLATEISLCYRLSNNKVPRQIQKMSSCSYRSFWSIHHSWTKTGWNRFHGSLNRRKGLYRSSSSSAELLLCLALRLFGEILFWYVWKPKGSTTFMPKGNNRSSLKTPCSMIQT